MSDHGWILVISGRVEVEVDLVREISGRVFVDDDDFFQLTRMSLSFAGLDEGQ